MLNDLIKLSKPLTNEYASDVASWDEIAELSEIFGYDFASLITQVDGEYYFRPITDLWNNLHLLRRLNDNDIPVDSPEGFRLFYVLALGLTLPQHNIDWIEQAYRAHENDVDLLVEAHRESNKTTTMELFLVFKLGLYPTTTNMLLRGAVAAAVESGKTVATTISRNKAFTEVFFPHIRPDTGDSTLPGRQGGQWNISGYAVIDTRIPDAEWNQLIAGRRGWSLMIFSPESGGVRGKRVNGVMLMDDLVTAKHSHSEAEMDHLIVEVNRAVNKTRTAEAFTIVLGTPQRAGDLLERLIMTESFEVIHQPLVNDDETINWPARFSPAEVEKRKREDLEDGLGFDTEYQLDRTAMENREFETWMTFPASQLNLSQMQLIACVDPASFNPTGGKYTQSHAAYSVYGYEPKSGLYVVVGGWVGQIDLHGLADRLGNLNTTYPTLIYVIIEEDGIGSELIAVMARNYPSVKLAPVKTKGMSKEDRLAAFLKPWLAQGQLRISTGDDIYLTYVREALTRYPQINRRGHLMDILDTLAWVGFAIKKLPQALVRKKKDPATKGWWQSLAEMK